MSLPIVGGAVSRAKTLYFNLRWIGKNLGNPANPLRYVHGSLRKALRPRETLRRRSAARRLSARLDPAVAEAVRVLERDGMATVTPLVDPALLQELARYFEEVVVPRRDQAGAPGARAFFSHMRTADDLAEGGIATRFALQEKIVSLLSAYMGKLPFIRNLSFLESLPTESKEWEQSQLWHRDFYFNYRTPSLWVYLSDVNDVAQGPFTYLPVGPSRRVKGTLIPRPILDEEIEKAGLAGEVRQVFAPKLTCFMLDNSRIYHLGSRMGQGGRRSVYIAHYVDPFDEKPWLKAGAVPEETKLLVERV